MNYSESDAMRLDRWLWAARFFKTRGLAAEAVSGGKVHVNGNRVKPAKTIRVGDQLRIRRGIEEFIVEVMQLNDKRRPAIEAANLYAETEESQKLRASLAEQPRQAMASRPKGRPTKKDRRQIVRFTGSDE